MGVDIRNYLNPPVLLVIFLLIISAMFIFPVLNMVLLGAVTADDNFPLSKESVIDAMKNNLKPKFHEMNLRAIESGYNSIKG